MPALLLEREEAQRAMHETFNHDIMYPAAVTTFTGGVAALLTIRMSADVDMPTAVVMAAPHHSTKCGGYFRVEDDQFLSAATQDVLLDGIVTRHSPSGTNFLLEVNSRSS